MCLQPGQRVGAGDQCDQDAVDDAGQIRVAGLSEDLAGQNRGNRQEHQHGEEPNNLHMASAPRKEARAEEVDVLDGQQYQRRNRAEYSENRCIDPRALAVLAAKGVVVEGVRRNRRGNLVGREQQQVGEYGGVDNLRV